MGFRFHRRLNLGGGAGLNVSKSGVSTSLRGRHGSIGTKGFSLRTGIPGLSFRQSWGNGKDTGTVALVFVAMALAVLALVQLATWLAVFLVHTGRWLYLTASDYLEYRRTGLVPDGDLRVEAAEIADDPNAKTLAEILAGTQIPAARAQQPAEGIEPPQSFSVDRPVVQAAGGTPAASLAIVAAGVGLALLAVLAIGSWLGDPDDAEPAAHTLTTWHAVMLDTKQPASIRLSNADAIIARFPRTAEAATAEFLRAELAQASGAETIQREAETAARAAERRALIDRKERRISGPSVPPSGASQPGHNAALVAAGAALVASQAEARSRSPAVRPTIEGRTQRAAKPKRARVAFRDATCPCSGSFNCTGPRGGQYCITSGGNKRYRSRPSYAASAVSSSGSCPCSGSRDCVGPRGGHYCYTSGGNNRYR